MEWKRGKDKGGKGRMKKEHILKKEVGEFPDMGCKVAPKQN